MKSLCLLASLTFVGSLTQALAKPPEMVGAGGDVERVRMIGFGASLEAQSLLASYCTLPLGEPVEVTPQ